MDIGFQCFVVFGAVTDEFLICQAFGDDDVEHGIEHGDVGIRFECEMVSGNPCQFGAAWVHQHQLRAFFHRILDEGGGDRVVDDRVGADDDNHLGILHVGNRIGNGTGAHTFKQRND